MTEFLFPLRPVNDFKSLVSPEDYARLDFVYIKTKEELAKFPAFVRGLGIKKILGQHCSMIFSVADQLIPRDGLVVAQGNAPMDYSILGQVRVPHLGRGVGHDSVSHEHK